MRLYRAAYCIATASIFAAVAVAGGGGASAGNLNPPREPRTAKMDLAQSRDSAVASRNVQASDLRRHIEILASDGFEGRRPATAGGDRTEAYLIEAFAQVGLDPGTGDGRWRQSVQIIERKSERMTADWSGPGGAIALPNDSILILGRERRVRLSKSPLVFGGYGRPEDLAGVDLRGKIVLHLSGWPVGDARPSMRLADRRASMHARGAAGAIAIAPQGVAWQQTRWTAQSLRNLKAGETKLLPAQGIISNEAAALLLRAAGSDLEQLTARSAERGFKARPLKISAAFDLQTSISLLETANIVGKITGRSRPDEAIVLLAHWDHLGICRPAGTPDRICNGAVDNASGVAILIETARHLAAGPRPERSIYILATTAEEGGLMGAETFANAPPVPKDRIVAALNIDTTAIGPAGLPVAIIGRGNYLKLEAVVDDNVHKLGRTVDPDTEANVMLTLQDGWAFGAQGIPAMMVTGAASDMDRLHTYLGGVYHGPGDDLANLKELEGAAEDATLQVALARALADPVQYDLPRR